MPAMFREYECETCGKRTSKEHVLGTTPGPIRDEHGYMKYVGLYADELGSDARAPFDHYDEEAWLA